MNSKVIVVTGANRGIGFEIARQLAARGAQVILTARKPEAGEEAVAKLKAAGLTVKFHPLDVLGEDSFADFGKFIAATSGKLDVLINNAGILPATDKDVLRVGLDTIEATLHTNTFAPLRLAQFLSGSIRKSSAGRIINVSSGMGALSDMGADHAAYRLSKTALNAVTCMLSAAMSGDGVAVNSVCPGWVRTDMGGPNAEREVSQGADSAVWLALDAPQSLTGKFIRDRKVIPW